MPHVPWSPLSLRITDPSYLFRDGFPWREVFRAPHLYGPFQDPGNVFTWSHTFVKLAKVTFFNCGHSRPVSLFTQTFPLSLFPPYRLVLGWSWAFCVKNCVLFFQRPQNHMYSGPHETLFLCTPPPTKKKKPKSASWVSWVGSGEVCSTLC